MKKRVFAAMMAALLVALTPITAFASTRDVTSWDEIVEWMEKDAAETEITLTLKANIAFEDYMETKLGQKVIINGETFVLTNVMIAGNGEAEINGNITSDDSSSALTTIDSCVVAVKGAVTGVQNGVDANGSSKVTVTGDVTATDSWGVYSGDDSEVTVTGDVTSENGTGIQANTNSSVTVTGNVTGNDGAGVETFGSADVTVNGDVSGGTHYGSAVEAEGESTVKIDGNVSGKDGNSEAVADGGYDEGAGGVSASQDAKVTVTGDVTGGKGYGTAASGGDGVDVYGNATVEVGGDVKGGDVTANPETTAKDDRVSHGGAGVAMNATSQVTVGGNVTGGSTNGDQGFGGDGVYIYLDLKHSTDDNEGSLNIGGTLSNGVSSKDNGTDGNAIWYELEQETANLALDVNNLTPQQEELLNQYVIPEVTIYQIDVKGKGKTVSVDGMGDPEDNEAIAKFLNAEKINYAIKTETPENGTLSVDKKEAIAGDVVTVTATPNAGYQLKSVQVYGETLEAKDGVYSFEVRENGGTTVSAVFEKIGSGQNDAEKANTDKLSTSSKSVATGDTTSVMGYVLMMGVAALCILTVVLRKRSK